MSSHSKAFIIFLMLCISLSARAQQQQQCMPLLGHLKLMALTEKELDDFMKVLGQCTSSGFPSEYCNSEIMTRTQGAIRSASPLRAITQSATTEEKLSKLRDIQLALEQFISMAPAHSDNLAVQSATDRATQILTPITQFIGHYDCRQQRALEGERNVAGARARDNSSRQPKEVSDDTLAPQNIETTPVSGRR